MKLKRLKMDAEKAVRGAWMSTGIVDETGTELRFRVRRYSQSIHSRFHREHMAEDWTQEQRGLAFIGGALVTAVEGLEDNDGNPIEWSPEFGATFFHDSQTVSGNEDDDDAEQFLTLGYIAEAVLEFAKADDPYIGELAGN